MAKTSKDQAILDFLKHSATITSASLVFVSGFSEKFFQETDRAFFVVSVVAFLVALVFNFAAYSLSLIAFFGRSEQALTGDRISANQRSKPVEWFIFLSSMTAVSMLVGFGAIAFGATRIW